jgi:hypothetical protein
MGSLCLRTVFVFFFYTWMRLSYIEKNCFFFQTGKTHVSSDKDRSVRRESQRGHCAPVRLQELARVGQLAAVPVVQPNFCILVQVLFSRKKN